MARITDLLKTGRTFSFEFFPPRNDEEQARLTRTISDLQPLQPDFVSVTYRGGRSSRERTTRVVIDILGSTRITPMPHLTCVAHPRFELGEIIGGFRAAIDRNMELAAYAEELVGLARMLGFESIAVAAHPAGHPKSPDRQTDRKHLAAKLQAADFAITQFFFHVEEWQRLVDELAALGIDKPVIPGIMPITNLASIQRMAQLSGYAVPADVIAQLEKGGDDPQAVRRIGIELACALCTDLLEAGVPGLHFYTLNFSTATREIYSGLGLVTA